MIELVQVSLLHCYHSCLSLSCKTYLSYNAFYRRKESSTLSLVSIEVVRLKQWVIYSGRNAPSDEFIITLGFNKHCDIWLNKSAWWLFIKEKQKWCWFIRGQLWICAIEIAFCISENMPTKPPRAPSQISIKRLCQSKHQVCHLNQGMLLR